MKYIFPFQHPIKFKGKSLLLELLWFEKKRIWRIQDSHEVICRKKLNDYKINEDDLNLCYFFLMTNCDEVRETFHIFKNRISNLEYTDIECSFCHMLPEMSSDLKKDVITRQRVRHVEKIKKRTSYLPSFLIDSILETKIRPVMATVYFSQSDAFSNYGKKINYYKLMICHRGNKYSDGLAEIDESNKIILGGKFRSIDLIEFTLPFVFHEKQNEICIGNQR